MKFDRRNFIKLAAGAVAAGIVGGANTAHAKEPHKIKAVAFDGFPIFDPRPIFALAETLFPGKGAELSDAWRTRQFEYQWLRALSGQYADFWKATEDGLIFAARKLNIKMTGAQREQLMGAYLKLKAWPDVPESLQALKDAGIRLTFLSNLTADMLHTNMRNAGIESYFDHAISTDRIKTFKPDPHAYQLGVDVLGLEREEIAFAAFAGWDMAGAKWFGYPTFWVNRAGFPDEELGVKADGTGKSLKQLVEFVRA